MGNRLNNQMAHFWVSNETDELVKRIACERDTSASSVYRDMVEKGLAASGYRSAQQSMQEAVRSTVDQVIQPHVDRLAAISAKAAQISAAAFQISAAAFFLAAYNGAASVPDYRREEYDEVASMARKLGVEYLKLSKDRSLDEFIGRGLHRMGDDR